MSDWGAATAVKQISETTYSCDFQDGWCVGSVPNGGYVTGCILEVVKTHFATTLAKQNQPHTIALHVEFLRRTQIGPAIFNVENVKLGRQASVIHVRVAQDGREEIIAYVTNSNIDTEKGYTTDTQYTLSPAPSPVDLKKLQIDEDPNWYRANKVPQAAFRKVTNRVIFNFPRNISKSNLMIDQWLCFSDGTNFTNTAIGFVVDMFPQLVEVDEPTAAGKYWYPTLLLNLDVKKALPPEGVKWLQIRAQAKSIKNGRMDIEVHVYDANGDLVALSHHVGLVVDIARNLAVRRSSNL